MEFVSPTKLKSFSIYSDENEVSQGIFNQSGSSQTPLKPIDNIVRTPMSIKSPSFISPNQQKPSKREMKLNSEQKQVAKLFGDISAKKNSAVKSHKRPNSIGQTDSSLSTPSASQEDRVTTNESSNLVPLEDQAVPLVESVVMNDEISASTAPEFSPTELPISDPAIVNSLTLPLENCESHNDMSLPHDVVTEITDLREENEILSSTVLHIAEEFESFQRETEDVMLLQASQVALAQTQHKSQIDALNQECDMLLAKAVALREENARLKKLNNVPENNSSAHETESSAEKIVKNSEFTKLQSYASSLTLQVAELQEALVEANTNLMDSTVLSSMNLSPMHTTYVSPMKNGASSLLSPKTPSNMMRNPLFLSPFNRGLASPTACSPEALVSTYESFLHAVGYSDLVHHVRAGGVIDYAELMQAMANQCVSENQETTSSVPNDSDIVTPRRAAAMTELFSGASLDPAPTEPSVSPLKEDTPLPLTLEGGLSELCASTNPRTSRIAAAALTEVQALRSAAQEAQQAAVDATKEARKAKADWMDLASVLRTSQAESATARSISRHATAIARSAEKTLVSFVSLHRGLRKRVKSVAKAADEAASKLARHLIPESVRRIAEITSRAAEEARSTSAQEQEELARLLREPMGLPQLGTLQPLSEALLDTLSEFKSVLKDDAAATADVLEEVALGLGESLHVGIDNAEGNMEPLEQGGKLNVISIEAMKEQEQASEELHDAICKQRGRSRNQKTKKNNSSKSSISNAVPSDTTVKVEEIFENNGMKTTGSTVPLTPLPDEIVRNSLFSPEKLVEALGCSERHIPLRSPIPNCSILPFSTEDSCSETLAEAARQAIAAASASKGRVQALARSFEVMSPSARSLKENAGLFVSPTGLVPVQSARPALFSPSYAAPLFQNASNNTNAVDSPIFSLSPDEKLPASETHEGAVPPQPDLTNSLRRRVPCSLASLRAIANSPFARGHVFSSPSLENNSSSPASLFEPAFRSPLRTGFGGFDSISSETGSRRALLAPIDATTARTMESPNFLFSAKATPTLIRNSNSFSFAHALSEAHASSNTVPGPLSSSLAAAELERRSTRARARLEHWRKLSLLGASNAPASPAKEPTSEEKTRCESFSTTNNSSITTSSAGKEADSGRSKDRIERLSSMSLIAGTGAMHFAVSRTRKNSDISRRGSTVSVGSIGLNDVSIDNDPENDFYTEK